MHSIVICDDHRLFGEALAQVLVARGYDVVACADSPDVGVAAVAAAQPDLYLTDLCFSGSGGVEVVAAARAASPRTRVLVLSGAASPGSVQQCRDAGASGFVGKDLDLDCIVAAVASIARGEERFDDPVAMPPTSPRREANGFDKEIGVMRILTAREREVLERLVSGQSTTAMARDMGVAYSTTRTHIQNLLTKLGVHSKLEAVALAARDTSFRQTSH